MVKTKDGIIVLLFMLVVALLNALIRSGAGITGAVDDIRKENTAVMPEISEADLEAMQQQAGAYITEESNWWNKASLVGYEYIGNYILQGKDEQVEYPYQIYLVNRVWMAVNDDLSDIMPYYHLVKFSDATISGEDRWEIIPGTSTPENGLFSLEKVSSIYVKGYESIEELYASAIEKQVEQYKCTADIAEDKVSQKSINEVNFADIKWAEEFEGADMGMTGEKAQTYEDSRLAKWTQINGESITEDGMYEYNAQFGIVTITKYVGQETEVVIPEEIAYRTKIVLDSDAFLNTNVISLTLSDSVIKISSNTFWENVSLEKIDIPGSVEIIERHTFHGCTNLKEVILEEGVTRIEECAFYRCTGLESIEIPPTVSFIASNAFQYSAVTSISIKSGCEAEDLRRDWSEPIEVTYYE